MATITGAGRGTGAIQAVFQSPFLLTLNDSGTVITASNSLGTVTINGSGFAYTSFVQNGTTFYQLTSGTITSIGYVNGSSNQTWSGLNVSAVDASNDLLNTSAFNNLFFSGDDTFNWQSLSSTSSILSGFDGNDTFNVSGWDNGGFGAYIIDGGSGTNTVNITGGIGGDILSYSDFSANLSNFRVTNVQTVNLAAGANYQIFASSSLVTSGNTLTINASALGVANRLVFNTNIGSGQYVTGNLVLLGGAGNDILEGSTGNTIYNGGGGNNTADFMWNLQLSIRAGDPGVIADLSNTGTQNFGTGYGTGTFINIQNLIGTRGNDRLTGDANDNVFTGEGGNDTINGGAGFDTAVFANPFATYTLTYSGGNTIVTGPEGTTTLNSVEQGQFSDQTRQISGPVVTTGDLRLAAGQSIPVPDHLIDNVYIGGGLFAVSDFNGADITEYQLWDGSSDPNAGHFVIDGAAQPTHTIITISAAQMAQATFVGGTADTSLQIRAFDGTSWSAGDNASWAQFTVGPDVEHAPVVVTVNLDEIRNRTLPVSSLFSVSDPDNDTITKYQLWDGTGDPNSGYFTVNGVAQAAHTVVTISADQLAQTNFVTGNGVSDSLQIRAYDGQKWSRSDTDAWSPFTVSVPESAPQVGTINTTKAAGQTLSLASLAIYGDADNDPATEYQLWDSTSDPNSGHWVVNGVVQPAHTIITISAAQAAQTTFVNGSVATSLQVRASDGILWSAADNAAWSPFTVSPTMDQAPVIFTSNVTAARGQVIYLSSLSTYIDADGDPATEYQLWDSTTDPNAGHWVVDGVPQQAHTIITISAAQAAQTTFVAGSVATSLQVRASDGTLWSAGDNDAWAPFTVSPPADHPPVVTTSDTRLAAGATVALSTLFSVSDPDGDGITKYELWESTRDPNAGYYTINGVRQAAGTIIDITAAQLAQTSFVAGSVATSLQIRANDGTLWSAGDNASWAPFTVSSSIDHAPVVTTGPVSASPNQTLQLSSLFSVSDPDGDTITKYELWESSRDPNSGRFEINGVVQAPGTIIDVTAAQLSQVTFVTGTLNADLQIRANDGQLWSAADTATWAPFKVIVDSNPPTVYGNDINATHGQMVPLSSLFSVSGGSPIQQYQVEQLSNFPNQGHLVVNGTVEPLQTVITIPASQLSQSYFVAASIPAGQGPNGDILQVSAFDGNYWSQTTDAFISVQTNSPPVVTTSDVNAPANQSLALSSLFTVSDADGDTMAKYELWDSTSASNSGHWVVNGAAQPSNAIIDITAAQLAQTSFLTGTVGDSLQIRAFDGINWSAADNANWAPFHVNVS